MANATHIRLAATAERLITKNGRSVTLVGKSVTPEDADKPWRGSDCNDDELPVIAAVVQAEETLVAGTVVRRGDKEAWVRAVAGYDLNDFDFLVDGEVRYNIDDVEEIKPGEVVIAYRLVLKR